MAERIDIAKLDLDVQGLIKSAQDSKAAILALKDEQKALKGAGEETSAQFIRNETEIKRLTVSYRSHTNAIQAQVSEGGKLQNQQDAIKLSVDRLNQSENEYRKNNTDLLKLRKDLNINSATYKQDLDAINKKINENNNWIKANVSEYEKQKIGIGGYSEGIKEAIKDTGIFNGALGALGADSGGVINVVQSFSPVLNDIGEKLKEAVVNLGFFKSSQEAAAVSTEILSAAESTNAAATTALTLSTEELAAAEAITATETTVLAGGTTVLAGAQTAQAGSSVAAAAGTNVLSGALTILQLVLDALGIGLIIAGIVLLIAAFRNFTPLIDKLEQGLAAAGAAFKVVLNAVIALVTGAKNLGSIFDGLGSDMSKAADEAVKLKKAQQDLEDAMALQEIATSRNRAAINRLNIQAKDLTKTEKERLAILEQASKIEEDDYNARKKNSDEAYRQALQKIRNEAQLSDAEFQRLKTISDAQKNTSKDLTAQEEADLQKRASDFKEFLEDRTGGVDDMVKELSDAQKKSIELDDEYYVNQEKRINKSNKIIEDAEKAREKALEERKKRDADYEKKRQEALNSITEKLKIELDIFLQVQGEKAKSVEEEIALAENVRKRKLAIAQATFNASKKSANDELKLTKDTNDANLEFIHSQNDAVLKNAESEYKKFQDLNKSKIDGSKFLNDALYSQEIDRLNAIASAEKDLFKTRLGDTEAYLLEESRINEESQKQKDELAIQRDHAERDRKLTDLENQKAADEDNFFLQMEADRQKLEIQREQELLEAEKTGADKNLINAKYAKLDKNIDQSVKDFKLQMRADLITGLKGLFSQESKLGKALAVADIINSTVTNASKAFQQAAVFASNPLTAALAANAVIQGGIIIATGAVQTAKTVGAKFEKGGLQEVGGNRHSAGGTVFNGSDGTRFEAERGELIGVMNRNAARHFMAFNNTFPSGASMVPNYFASGGIVSREISQQSFNIDELAIKMAIANAALPRPVVTVQDISYEGNKVIDVVDAKAL